VKSPIVQEEALCRVLVLELEGVLMPDGKPLAQPEDLIWVPRLSDLLQEWPDVRIVVTTGKRAPPAASKLPHLLGPLRSRLLGNTFGLVRGDAVEASVALVNGAQLVHLVLVSDATGLPSSRLNILTCNPEFGISGKETYLAVGHWLRNTDPSKAVHT
jgi:hypothetical protein